MLCFICRLPNNILFRNMGEISDFFYKTYEEYGIFHDCLQRKIWPCERHQNDVTSQYIFSQNQLKIVYFNVLKNIFNCAFLFYFLMMTIILLFALISEASFILFLKESTNSIPTISEF